MSAANYQKLLKSKKRGPAKIRFNSASGNVLEKEVQKSILDYLSLNQIFHWKVNNVGIKKENGSFIPTGLIGISDILGILPGGKFLAIEVKRPGGKPTPAQLEFIKNINDNGGLAFWTDSLDDVMEVIEKELKR